MADQLAASALAYVPQDPTPPVPAEESTPAARRTNRACDTCSRRKVKCTDERPCKNCIDADIECTTARTPKRRGPPNRVAEELKRLKLGGEMVASAQSSTQAGEGNTTSQFFPTMELLSSLDNVHQLIHKYYTYLYPHYLFPHETVFHEGLINRTDQVDSSFLTLVAAICAVTAQSYPRAARSIFMGLEHSAIGVPGETIPPALDTQSLVDHFIKVAVDARGTRHVLRPDLTVNDAIASFLLAVASSTAAQWLQYTAFMGECLTTLKMIFIRRHQSEGVAKNYVDLEIADRVQAAAFVHIQSIEHLGPAYAHMDFAMRSSDVVLPAEVDDDFLFPLEIRPQLHGRTALNRLANRVTTAYLTVHQALEQPSTVAAAAFPAALASLRALLADDDGDDDDGSSSAAAAGPSSYAPEPDPTVFLADADRRRLRLDVLRVDVRAAALACRARLLHAAADVAARAAADGDAALAAELRGLATRECEALWADVAAFLKALPAWLVEPHAVVLMDKLKRTLEILGEGGLKIATIEEKQFAVSRFRELEIEVAARSM